MKHEIKWEILNDPNFSHDGDSIGNEYAEDRLNTALDICGCSTKEPIDVLYAALFHCWLDHSDRSTDYDKPYGFNDVAFELALKVLDALDLTDHGCSVGGSWLNEDGEKLWHIINKRPSRVLDRLREELER